MNVGWPSDTLAGIYLFLFAFGLIFSVASLVLGAGGDDLLDLGGGEGAEAGGSGDGQSGGPSPFSISTAMIFLTWFGAAGYILRAYYGSAAALSFLVATVAGLVGGWLVYLFLARVLWRHQTELNPADYQVVGAVGRISSSIRSGGTGEVIYLLDGKQRVDGARSADGSGLPLGVEVIITRYEGGLAYVEPLASWAARRGEAADEPFIGQPIEPLDHPPPGRSAR